MTELVDRATLLADEQRTLVVVAARDLAHRAEQHHGGYELRAGRDGGTDLVWWSRLP